MRRPLKMLAIVPVYIRRLTCVALAALAVACQSIVGIEEVRGEWVLESVNGTSVPGSVKIRYTNHAWAVDHPGQLATKTVYIDERAYRFSNTTGALLDGFAGTFEYLEQGEVVMEGDYEVDAEEGVLTIWGRRWGWDQAYRFKIHGDRMTSVEEARDVRLDRVESKAWQRMANNYVYRRR